MKYINLPQHETKTNDLPFVCMETLTKIQIISHYMKVIYCSNRSIIGPVVNIIVNIIGEKQSGLGSIFKCSYCGHVNEVKSSGEHRAGNRGPLVSDINTTAVLGCLHAGMGNTHLNNLLLTMNHESLFV